MHYKGHSFSNEAPSKDAHLCNIQCFDNSNHPVLNPCWKENIRGTIFLLCFIFLGQYTQNILVLCASEVWRLLVPEMFTEFGRSALPGHLSHFLFLDWLIFSLFTKNSLSSVYALYCDKKETMNGFFWDNLRFKHHRTGITVQLVTLNLITGYLFLSKERFSDQPLGIRECYKGMLYTV